METGQPYESFGVSNYFASLAATNPFLDLHDSKLHGHNVFHTKFLSTILVVEF